MKSINHYSKAIINRSMLLINQCRGWSTKRKIIVFESDDWGSVRMPDRKTYECILASDIRVDKSHYNKYDTLASKTDFEHLYEVLSKHKDKNGNNPIITLNTIVANPNFDKIRESSYQEYYFEPFTETLKKYPNRSFDNWKEGIEHKLIYPQLHGREHLNVNRWMQYLQRPSQEVHFAFDNGLYGIGPKISIEGNPSFVQAFDSDVYYQEHTLERILKDACEVFENIFGFQSKSFIATNYIWKDNLEQIISQLGVKYLQGAFTRKYENKTYHNYLGKINQYNQLYLIRNASFEPSSNENIDWVQHTMKEIGLAFKFNKPATVCSHRVNFVGSIFEENRIRSLKQLDELLRQIIKKWPETEFMHSAELGDLIVSNKNFK